MEELPKLSDGVIQQQEPPRPTLPLPPELRNEIYSYLLDGNKVKYTPADYQKATHSSQYVQFKGRAHTYDFYTPLLAVNKTIYAEAKEYLFQRNQFILVHFAAFGLSSPLHLANVPIVTDCHLESFHQHVLSITLKFNKAACDMISKEELYLNSESVLILRQDFKIFCFMLRYMYQYTIPRCVVVSTKPGAEIVLRAPTSPTFGLEMAVTLHKTEYKTLGDVHQSSILKELQQVTGSGYELTLSGFSDSTLAAATKSTMAPGLMWFPAYDWDQLETALQMKQKADALAVTGDFRSALSRYKWLRQRCPALWSRKFLGSNRSYDLDATATGVRALHFIYDLRMSRVALILRLEDNADGALKDLAKLSRMPATIASSTKTLLWSRHLLLLAYMIQERANLFNKVASVVRNTIRLIKQTQASDEHWDHDSKILSEIMAVPKADRADVTAGNVVDRLSIRRLPARIYDSQPFCAQRTRPSNLVGWQHLNHLTLLSDDEKRAIQKKQEECGLEVSKF